MTHPSLSPARDCRAITGAGCGSISEHPEIVGGMNVLTKHACGSRIISLVSRCRKPFERCGCCQGLRTYLYQNRSTPIPKESAIKNLFVVSVGMLLAPFNWAKAVTRSALGCFERCLCHGLPVQILSWLV